MNIVSMLSSVFLFTLGLIFLGFSFRQLFLKRKLLVGGLSGAFALVLLLTSSVLLLLLINLQTYVQLTRETTLAEIYVGEPTERGYPVSFTRGDEIRVFWISSDEWRVDARFLKWKPWITVLGKDPVVRLESFTGRLKRNGIPPDPVYPLTDVVGVSEYLTTYLATHTLMADSLYGSSVYMPVEAQSKYRISATQAGLLARPVNTTGRQAVLDWKE
ncbi:MAG: hypothetical protein ABW076_09555 [Candidatus Thiodiazotropha sp.]